MTIEQLKAMIEVKITEAQDANHAPFGMDHKEAAIYNAGKITALNWVLEMLG